MANVQLTTEVDTKELAWMLTRQLRDVELLNLIMNIDELVSDIVFTVRLRDRLNRTLSDEPE